MQLAGKRWICYPSRSLEVTLYTWGDFHLLNRGCAVSQLERDVQEAAEDDEASLHFLVGDVADCVNYDDPRFDPSVIGVVTAADMGHLYGVTLDRAVEILRPLGERLLGATMGNHEEKYEKHNHQQGRYAEFCKELGCTYLGYSGFMDLTFCRVPDAEAPFEIRHDPPGRYSSWRVRVFLHHGRGAARTKSGKLRNVLKIARVAPHADLVLTGHVHTEFVEPITGIDADSHCTTVTEISRWAVACGSYLRTYTEGVSGYGEVKGYQPVELGPATLTIVPDKREIKR